MTFHRSSTFSDTPRAVTVRQFSKAKRGNLMRIFGRVMLALALLAASDSPGHADPVTCVQENVSLDEIRPNDLVACEQAALTACPDTATCDKAASVSTCFWNFVGPLDLGDTTNLNNYLGLVQADGGTVTVHGEYLLAAADEVTAIAIRDPATVVTLVTCLNGGGDVEAAEKTWVDPIVCPLLVGVRGTYADVTIDDQGDVYVSGEPLWDCPPYDILG